MDSKSKLFTINILVDKNITDKSYGLAVYLIPSTQGNLYEKISICSINNVAFVWVCSKRFNPKKIKI